MSKQNEKPEKQRSPRRPLFGEGSRFKEIWSGFVSRVGRVTGVTAIAEADGAPSEPIDFSAPSVPYYTTLADKFNLARIVLYMILFAFVAVTLISGRQLVTYENLYYLVKDINAAGITAQSEADHLNYPMSSTTPSFAPFRGGLVVAGGEEITVLSGSGKQTLSHNVSLSFPCVSAGGQYFVVFGRGEKNFSVYNAFVRVHHRLTEYPVYDACMGQDGSLAILTRSRDYNSEVVWYNDKMNKLAACHLGGYVADMAVSTDSRTLAVVSMETKNGAYESKLTLLRRGGGGTVTYQEVIVSGGCLGAEFLSEDRLCVVYTTGVRTYRVDGHAVSEDSFEGAEPLLFGSTSGYCALLMQSNTALSRRYLTVYDKNGSKVYEAAVEDSEKYSSLVMIGQDVYLQGAGHILRVRNHGKTIEKATAESNTLSLMADTQGRLLALTPAYARYVEGDAFSAEN